MIFLVRHRIYIEGFLIVFENLKQVLHPTHVVDVFVGSLSKKKECDCAERTSVGMIRLLKIKSYCLNHD